MNICQAQLCGKNKTKCEDVIYTRTDEESGFCFVGIADGQSRKPYAREGARAALIMAAKVLESKNLCMIKEQKTDELRAELASKIYDALYILADTLGGSISDFNSTLLCVACNMKTGGLVTAHLGDGQIDCLRDGRLEEISGPENGITKNLTYLTGSNMMRHLRVQSGDLKDFDGFCLSTDGAWAAVSRIRHRSRRETEFSDEAFMEQLKQTHPEDDATIVMLDLR